MINPKYISIIVQGSVSQEETPRCIESIRGVLPDAEIILSTYKGEDVANLDYDILVQSDDPGAVLIDTLPKHKPVYNNMNRQLVTTKAGLKHATRKYAMKLRSDAILTSDKFLNYFDMFPKRTENYKLFERKIITNALFTRFYIKGTKSQKPVIIPFHISDWWFFGLRNDLETYFLDTELVEEPNFTNYFALEENKAKFNPYGIAKFKFAPEQYFGYSCFARNFDDIYMEDASDFNEDLMEKFREALVNNFIILEFEQSGIYLNKYLYSKNEKFSGDQYLGLYHFHRYENEYKKYCDNDYVITTKDDLWENKNLAYAKLRIYKHIYKLTNPATPLYKKLEQFVIGIPISVITYLIDVLKEKLGVNVRGKYKRGKVRVNKE